MSVRRLLGERVAVRVTGCPTRDGVLISGVKKPDKRIQKFHVRFPNGDVRTYRGDQLLLRGTRANFTDYIRVGDIMFTKKTLGVVRFIGLHEEFKGTIIVIEPVDPRLPKDPNVVSFRKLFPSANLSDSRSYRIITRVEEILKLLPPDSLLQQISKIKDKYLALKDETRARDRLFEQERSNADMKIQELENLQVRIRNKQENGDEGDDDLPQIETVTEKFQPGRLGIQAIWATGAVIGVIEDGQALRLGVQVNWKILKIDDEEYTEDGLNAKIDGEHEYTLTFEVQPQPEEDRIEPEREKTPPPPVFRGGLSTSEKDSYETKISELNDQIEELQYTVEGLQSKNVKLEEDHKEVTKLRVKVDHLRHSRVMFMSQIKEIQKVEREWKNKALEFERKRNELERSGGIGGGVEAKNNDSKKLIGKDKIKSSGRRRKMPTPEASNTVSLLSLNKGQKRGNP